MTTMLLSTSMPTPSARPDSEMMFSVTSVKYISVMAHIRLNGMLHATINVGFAVLEEKGQHDDGPAGRPTADWKGRAHPPMSM